MHRIFRSFPIKDVPGTKMKMLNWASRFNIFCFLDDHGYGLPLHGQELLVGAGARHRYEPASGQALAGLDGFMHDHQDWIMGHFSYDLKNEIETLRSAHPERTGFSDLGLFVPEVLVTLRQEVLSIGLYDETHEEVLKEIISAEVPLPQVTLTGLGPIVHGMSERGYMDVIAALQAHIRHGDCYELNFCMEHHTTVSTLDPVGVFAILSAVSPNPFSALYRNGDAWLLCASPERFLRKHGGRLHAQPIKGTSPRHPADKEQDERSRLALMTSGKERSENVMVVDLVRNDLSRICIEGSVRVDELFGVRSFPQVHQMISTVSGIADPRAGFSDILRAAFPMGSMTGAPKRRVMELIERYEGFRRGLFSGAVGYFTPDGDFDLNVVIRSLMYNGTTGRLSFPTGSGITFYADARQEYAECLLKAAAMEKTLKLATGSGS